MSVRQVPKFLLLAVVGEDIGLGCVGVVTLGRTVPVSTSIRYGLINFKCWHSPFLGFYSIIRCVGAACSW